MYWADELAKQTVEKFPERKKYVCACGMTPSGTVHIGHLREVLTSEFVMRALKDFKKDAELIWSWDDYDRFRKIPQNVPKDFEKYLGMPICNIPDPFDCHDSYAEHFEAELEESLPDLGITARIIRQSEMYKKNAYFEGIKEAMQKRKKIAEVLYSYKAKGGTKEEIENYYPLNVYCEKCKKDTTQITDYDEENKVSYKCECGHEETVDISKKNIGKLAWRVDWPMRWKYEGVSFEPAGRDHISAGGSVDVSSHLARDVFGFEPQVFQGYEWIGISGGTHKMSSSTGEAFTPKMLLEIYEPELVRWFYARVRPLSAFDFALDDQIIKNYAEWDEYLKNYNERKLDERSRRILYFCKTGNNQTVEPGSTSFRQLASFAQLTKGNIELLKDAIKQSGGELSNRDIEVRLPRALSWSEKYAPAEYRIKLKETPDLDYYNQLPDNQKENLNKLTSILSENWDHDKLSAILYEIPKRPNLTEEEIKAQQREFFKVIYNLLIGADTGPRLATFFLALGKEKILDLLAPKS